MKLKIMADKPNNRPVDQTTKQPTDGHEGSSGSFNSISIYCFKSSEELLAISYRGPFLFLLEATLFCLNKSFEERLVLSFCGLLLIYSKSFRIFKHVTIVLSVIIQHFTLKI